MIFPFDCCVFFLSLGLRRTRPQAGAASDTQEGLEGGEAFQDTYIDQIKGTIVVMGCLSYPAIVYFLLSSTQYN